MCLYNTHYLTFVCFGAPWSSIFWPGFSYIAFPEWKTAVLIFKRERQRDRMRERERVRQTRGRVSHSPVNMLKRLRGARRWHAIPRFNLS